MKLWPLRLKSWFWLGVRVIIGIYLLTLMMMFYMQERLLFVPTRLAGDYQFHFHEPAEERYFTVDSMKIHSLLFRVPEAKGIVLYFHGNGGCLAGWGEVAEELSERMKWNVWIVDYPGFGKSEGDVISEEQLHRVANALYAAARAEFPDAKIVPLGRSIGTGIALKLASEQPVAGLILESPYYSLVDVASVKYPWVPMALLRYRIRSDLWMPKVTAPVLIAHGTDDEVIPFEQGLRLSGLAQHGEFVQLPGAHHNDIDQYPQLWNALEPFFSKL